MRQARLKPDYQDTPSRPRNRLPKNRGDFPAPTDPRCILTLFLLFTLPTARLPSD